MQKKQNQTLIYDQKMDEFLNGGRTIQQNVLKSEN